MQLLDSGHLPSCLGHLETVADQNGYAVYPQDAGVSLKTRAHQMRVSLLRSRAGLWKKSNSRS
jgi:hypothetical protein